MRPGDTGDDPPEGSGPDRPIDIEALRADDELVEALVAGVVRPPRDRSGAGDNRPADPEAALRAMLSAWVLDVRPETVVSTDLPASPAPAAPGDRPPVEPAEEPVAEPAGVVPITIGRRRLTVRPQYVRRLAVAAAMIVLLGSGLAVGAWDARPGGTLWPVAKVFYAERAKSIQAAADVTTGLEKARTALKVGNRAEAATAIASVSAALAQVAPDQGHDMLVAQQQELVVALGDTPIPPGTTTDAPGSDPASAAALAPTSDPAAAPSSPATAVTTTPPAAEPTAAAPPADTPPTSTATVDPAPVDPAPTDPPSATEPPAPTTTTEPAPPSTADPAPPAAEQSPTSTPAATPTDPAPPPAAAPTDTAAPATVAPAGRSAAAGTPPTTAPAHKTHPANRPSPGLLGNLVNVVTSVIGAILGA